MVKPGTVYAGSSGDGKTHGVASRDKAGRYCYVQLNTIADTRALISELLDVERKQLEAELPPNTQRSGELERIDEIRGAT